MRVIGGLIMLTVVAHAQAVGAIEGRVLDHSCMPARALSISAYRVDGAEPFCRQTETNGDGRFVLREMPTGHYRIEVRPGQSAPTAKQLLFKSLIAQAATTKDGRVSAESVRVESGESARCDIQLPRSTAVTVVLRAARFSTAGATLSLHRMGRRPWSDGRDAPRAATVDASGRARFADISEGDYIPTATIEQWEVTCDPVAVVSAEQEQMVEVRLGEHVVNVRVVDAQGRPTLRVKLGLISDKDTGVHWVGDDPIEAADGVYAIPCARPGKWQAYVNIDGAYAESRWFDIDKDLPLVPVAVTLPAMGTLVVAVVDSRGAVKVGELVVVTRVDGGGTCSVRVDADGTARFVLPIGKWRMAVEDRPEARSEAHVSEGKTTSVRLEVSD